MTDHNLESSHQHGPFIITSSKVMYQNPWAKVTEHEVIRPGGGEGRFGIFTVKSGSTVLPIDKNGDAWLTREFKFAGGNEMFELMSGAIEPGETPIRAAKRELKEELGMTARHWRRMMTLHPFPTLLETTETMFLARGLTPGESSPEAGEIIVPVKMPFKKVARMAAQGKIRAATSAALILAVDHLNLWQ